MTSAASTTVASCFLEPAEFYHDLKQRGFDFFTGVPDSLLKDFCAYLANVTPPQRHVITVNEGASVALATGYHLATKRYPVVYMQSSGVGNATDPLISLCDAKVYSIPMLLLIGWRGGPGTKDEPQHEAQGEELPALLTCMKIPFEVLPNHIAGAREVLEIAANHFKSRQTPFALLVSAHTFSPYHLKAVEPQYPMTREEACRLLIERSTDNDFFVTTTGYTPREVYDIRNLRKEGHEKDFLAAGGMGHCSAIALGIALSKPSRTVWCIDGDGALLMHMGSLATIGQSNAKNYKHILINNGAHDSVGGQPSNGFHINFTQIAAACGYKYVTSVSTSDDLIAAIANLKSFEGPCFVEVLTRTGSRQDLSRPQTSPLQNKSEFMDYATADT